MIVYIDNRNEGVDPDRSQPAINHDKKIEKDTTTSIMNMLLKENLWNIIKVRKMISKIINTHTINVQSTKIASETSPIIKVIKSVKREEIRDCRSNGSSRSNKYNKCDTSSSAIAETKKKNVKRKTALVPLILAFVMGVARYQPLKGCG